MQLKAFFLLSEQAAWSRWSSEWAQTERMSVLEPAGTKASRMGHGASRDASRWRLVVNNEPCIPEQIGASWVQAATVDGSDECEQGRMPGKVVESERRGAQE
eukprot:5277419-Pleurochrysis_carterae.AAC.2